MTNFFHKFFNPHCPDCRTEVEDSKVCNSCETLKMEIERLRHENEKLLDRVLEKPAVHAQTFASPDLKPIMPKGALGWNARRQMLEVEDRERARLMKAAPKPDPAMDPGASTYTGVSSSVEELEKELDINNG